MHSHGKKVTQCRARTLLNRLVISGGRMFGIGIPELIIILVIVLVIFGANKLPEIGSGMGRAIKNFKKATNEPDEIDIGTQKEDKNKNDSEKKTEY